MTEDEAKKRWCPFARLYNMNRAHEMVSAPEPEWPAQCACIASACMAWRWTDPLYQNPALAELNKDRNGHCGLAGKP